MNELDGYSLIWSLGLPAPQKETRRRGQLQQSHHFGRGLRLDRHPQLHYCTESPFHTSIRAQSDRLVAGKEAGRFIPSLHLMLPICALDDRHCRLVIFNLPSHPLATVFRVRRPFTLSLYFQFGPIASSRHCFGGKRCGGQPRDLRLGRGECSY